MDQIDSLLGDKRTKIATLERALETERAELRGMEALASAINSGVKTHAGRAFRVGPLESGTKPKGSGRQPGAISKRWRFVLETLLLLESDWFPAETVVETVRALEQREIRPAEVRRIFDGYIEHGYVVKDDAGLYRVSDQAAEKFGLARTSPKENEAPSSYLPEPQKPAGWGVPPPPSAWINPQSGPAS